MKAERTFDVPFDDVVDLICDPDTMLQYLTVSGNKNIDIGEWVVGESGLSRLTRFESPITVKALLAFVGEVRPAWWPSVAHMRARQGATVKTKCREVVMRRELDESVQCDPVPVFRFSRKMGKIVQW